MKKVLPLIILIAGFAACKSKKDDLNTEKELLPVNPVSYASSVLTDTAAVSRNEDIPETEVVVYRKRPKQKVIYYDEPVVYTQAPATTPNTDVVTTPAPVITSTPTSTVPDNFPTTTGEDNTSSVPATEAKKKGWSNSAKGAVIGAVGGAIAGAVINGKNRGKGAIIGGIIGAAGGYIIGKKKDKKDTNLASN